MPNGGPTRKPAAAPTRKRPAAAPTRKRPAAATDPETHQDAFARSVAPRESMELKKWKTQYKENLMGKTWVGTLKGLAWDTVANEVTEQWWWAPEKADDAGNKDKANDAGNGDTGKDMHNDK